MDEADIEHAVDYESPEAETADTPAETAEQNAAAAEPTTAEKQQEEPATNGGNASAGDPSDPMSLPPHGTEVFVGGLPRNATEAQVREFAEQAGEVHSVKVLKDPNNAEQNRGFGFVRYHSKESAEAAKQKLHETELKGTGSKVRVSSTQPKHKLFLGNIPKSWTQEKVSEELSNVIKGVESLDVPASKEAPGENRGFGFLTFYNHECAAAAKEALTKASFSLDGRQITVNYAEPKHSEMQQQQPSQQNKSVYVGKLPPGATGDALKEIFAKYGEIDRVVIPAATEKRPEQRFGFVHFADAASAEKAIAEAAADPKPELNGSVLEVKAARPSEPRPGHDAGFGFDGGYGGRGAGRGPMRGRGRGGQSFGPRGRGVRGGRGGPPGRADYYGYNQGGYDQGFDPGYGSGYGYDQSVGYGGYGGGMAAPAGTQGGMTMVPMMLPSGQVGYVLQSPDMGGADYGGSYGAPGPDRSYGGQYGGRGRGRGPSRYRPY